MQRTAGDLDRIGVDQGLLGGGMALMDVPSLSHKVPLYFQEPMNTDSPFWNELLLYLEQALVIPVIGQDLLEIEYEGRTVNAYRLLAERLAESLGVAQDTLPPNFTVSQVIAAYPRFREKRSLVYTQIKAIYDRLPAATPGPLKLLAQIPAFRIFLTTTFDTWMEKALLEERFAGVPRPLSIAYSTGTPPPDLSIHHLTSNQPVVFQLFGRVSPAPQYAATEEDVLEYLHQLQAYPPPNLCEVIRGHHLLFIGNAFSDWLARFFVRTARGERLFAQRGKEVFIVDDELKRSATLMSFFQGFCWETNVMPETTPCNFVRLLHQKWGERHPPIPPEAPAPLVPRVAAPEEPTRASHLIFVSYASQDFEAASHLCDALSRVGLNVWLDQRGRLEEGDLFREKIRRDIWRSTLFMPVLSRNADRRDEGFFREEWAEALGRLPRFRGASRPFIIPVIVDDLDLRAAVNVPDEFKDVHVTTAPNGFPTDESVSRLQRIVRNIVKTEGTLS